MSTESNLYNEIRLLCAKYGYRSVQEGVHTVIQEEYAALKSLVEGTTVLPKETPKKVVTKAKKENEKKVQEEFAPAAEVFQEDLIDGLVDSTKLGQIKSGTEIVVSKLGAAEEPETKPTFFTAAEERQWQKEEEAKTRAKLDATGISPESLLNRENLEQWIQKEKKGYAYVARRHVGLPESAVVAACKELWIVSEAAKRRQAIVASRMNAKRGRGRGH